MIFIILSAILFIEPLFIKIGVRVDKALLVGITGGTGSGKTTLADRVIASLSESQKSDVVVIGQDRYYRDLLHMPLEKRHLQNFDHPDAIDRRLLAEHLKLLAQGKKIDAPLYDFKTHTRKPDTERVGPCKVCIVEGIHILVYPEIRELLDIKIFIDTSDDIRFIRRLSRDIKERGRTPEMVIEQYLSTVKPMHLEFVLPSKRFADVIIPWDDDNRAAAEIVISRIKEFLG